MAKGGLLQALAPVLGIGAALAAPEVLPALGLGEAAAGGGAAAGLSDAVPAGLLDASGGVIPDVGAATTAELGATPLAADALAGVGNVTGLLGAAAPAVAGQAAELGAAQGPGLLAAATPSAAAPVAPSLASTAPATAPIDTGAIAATPAAAGYPGAGLPAGFDPTVSPDLTVAGGGELGPPIGQTDAFLGTSTLSPGSPGDTSVTSPIAAPPAASTGGATLNPDLSDFAGGTPGAGGQDIGSFGESAPTGFEAGLGDVGSWAASHPGALLTAGLAGSQLLRGQPTYPAAQSLQGLATPTGTQGYANVGAGTGGLLGQAATTAGETAALTAPLTTGVLPPGLQQMVQQGETAQEAADRSAAAAQGLSSSTMLASKLGQDRAAAAGQEAQLAEGLLPAAQGFSAQTGQAYSNVANTGAALSGMSLQAYNDLVRTQMQTDQNYQAALYKFAAALAGGGYQPPVANA